MFKAQEPPQDAPRHSKLVDTLLTAAGLKGMGAASPYARGKIQGYHGSTPERMAIIKREGIKTMGEMADRGQSLTKHILDAQGLDAFNDTKGMAFTGPKGLARSFVAQAQSGARPLDKPDFSNNKEMLAYSQKVTWQAIKNRLKFVNPLRVEIPVSEASRLVSNPEILSGAAALKARGVPDFLAKIQLHPLTKSPGIVGGVRASEIVGGQGYKWLSRAGMAAKPLRAAGGVAGLLGSGALAAYGLKDMYKNMKQVPQ